MASMNHHSLSIFLMIGYKPVEIFYQKKRWFKKLVNIMRVKDKKIKPKPFQIQYMKTFISKLMLCIHKLLLA